MRGWRIPHYTKLVFYGLILRRRCRKCGKFPLSDTPLEWYGLNRMTLGDRIHIGLHCWLAAIPGIDGQTAGIRIGSGTRLGNFNHIIAAGSLVIGSEVLTADHVYISDNTHEYKDINIPVMRQPVRFLREVSIGDGSWLGEHVCILGAKIGRHCIIGANSVVTHDIPDYCVAAGAPARILRRFDKQSGHWVRTET